LGLWIVISPCFSNSKRCESPDIMQSAFPAMAASKILSSSGSSSITPTSI